MTTRADTSSSGGRSTATIAARFDPPHPMRVAEQVNPVVMPTAKTAEPLPSMDAIDAGHEPHAESSSSIPNLFAPTIPDDVREQLVRQANELAAHLRGEAEHVDRREAQLHARLAELEQQLRSATLCDFEQRVELERRADALDQRERELEQRAAAIESAERFVDAARLDIDQRLAKLQSAEKSAIEHEHSLKERERLLVETRQQLDEQSRRLGARLTAQRDELDRHAAVIKEKLARGMATLEQRRTTLNRLQSQIEARYRQLAPQTGSVERSA